MANFHKMVTIVNGDYPPQNLGEIQHDFIRNVVGFLLILGQNGIICNESSPLTQRKRYPTRLDNYRIAPFNSARICSDSRAHLPYNREISNEFPDKIVLGLVPILV